MRTTIYILLIQFCLTCQVQGKVIVTVSNPCNFDRQSDLVELFVSDIKKKILLTEGETYLVKNMAGEIISSQITYNSKLIFPCGLRAKEKTVFTILAGKPQCFTSKVFGTFFPQRKNDFVWENDRVGFRFYGDSLKYSDGPSNGMDLWYKRTNKMVLQKWYDVALTKGIWFHDDKGEGCDAYAVGRSLGAGAMAPCIEGNVVLNENFLQEEILDNGPLRFTARLIYPDFQIDGKIIHESRIVSLDAGSQLTAITENYEDANFPVAAGFVKRASADSVVSNLKSGYFIYAEPKTKENGSVFLGIYMPSGIDSVYTASYSSLNPINKKTSRFTHTLGTSKYKSTPLTYYTGFGWEKFGFPTMDSFEKYMEKFILSKKCQLKIKIN